MKEETLTVSQPFSELMIIRIGEIDAGLGLTEVQEVNDSIDFTEVYAVLDCVRGVLNIRGEVITVLDLRTLLGIEATGPIPDQRVIIVNAGGERVGLLADSVLGVSEVQAQQVESITYTSKGKQSYFSHVCHFDDRVVNVLDIAAILNPS
ncbi:MAG: chemotaxis protein CheW [Chlamydiia bacterium]|nr:chemotaxis protein CheW [Chlamydiia bacterium]